jgi:hypothetical protein
MRKADANEIALRLMLEGAAAANVVEDRGNNWEIVYRHCPEDPGLRLTTVSQLASGFHRREKCRGCGR